MMRFTLSKLTVALAVIGALGLAPMTAGAVDSSALVRESARYDGRTVTFRGEVIGDVMRRRDGVWLNINDDAYSRQGTRFRLAGYNSGQGVLVPKTQTVAITMAGNYKQRGDVVEVIGTFRRASAKHGGQMMIEGRSLKVIKRGFPLESPISRRKIILAIISITAAATIMGLSRVIAATRRPG